ncbi:MAG: (5-formylfuran-3-yl)methyl phosphate synthase [Pseudomonadota bacterium]
MTLTISPPSAFGSGIERPKSGHPLFLASVRSLAEAELVVGCGADIVDCKDPERGALGALEPHTILEVMESVAGRVPVSATIGDCPPDFPSILDAMGPVADTGVDIVKIGFAPGPDVPNLIRRIGGVTPAHDGQRRIAVFFADQGFQDDWITACAEAGFIGVMVDTAGKSSGPLSGYLGGEDVSRFVNHGHQLGLLMGLAGGLRPSDVPRYRASGADVLGFRGGLCCKADRKLGLDADAVKGLRRILN